MEKQVAAIYDNFDGGESTIEYTDGSKQISGPNGKREIPPPGKLNVVKADDKT